MNHIEDSMMNISYIFGRKKMYVQTINKNIGADLKGWSTGTSALYVACRDLAPTKVVLLGFDHEKNEYDNVYADTINYFKESNDEEGWYTWKHWKNEHELWKNQIKQVKDQFSSNIYIIDQGRECQLTQDVLPSRNLYYSCRPFTE